ncbi:MAG TPA: hypothetical protein VFS75_03370 [Candidatus Paceibacterota bacterium]|nr:hypothetical protein [Candidatus Paceibacterota bacterium]
MAHTIVQIGTVVGIIGITLLASVLIVGCCLALPYLGERLAKTV